MKRWLPGARTSAKFIEEGVYDALTYYSWPGNVRELRNVMTHMALLADKGCVGVGCLPRELLEENGQAEGVPATYDELKELKKVLKAETGYQG